jgi:hypothetical protein
VIALSCARAKIANVINPGVRLPKAYKRLHVHIVIGALVMLVAFFCWIYLLDGMSYFAAGKP